MVSFLLRRQESRNPKTGFPRVKHGAGLVKPGMTKEEDL